MGNIGLSIISDEIEKFQKSKIEAEQSGENRIVIVLDEITNYLLGIKNKIVEKIEEEEKMKNRYRMDSLNNFIEFEHSEEGKKQAIDFRNTHVEFKGRHLTNGIQAYPSKIKINTLYSKHWD